MLELREEGLALGTATGTRIAASLGSLGGFGGSEPAKASTRPSTARSRKGAILIRMRQLGHVSLMRNQGATQPLQ